MIYLVHFSAITTKRIVIIFTAFDSPHEALELVVGGLLIKALVHYLLMDENLVWRAIFGVIYIQNCARLRTVYQTIIIQADVIVM